MIERIPQVPPIIAKSQISDGPLWSVMITTYNCYAYISEAITSVLLQDPGKDLMQIEVIDDFSTDGDVKLLVEKLGKGRVDYFCQESNMGSLRNFETAINRSKGKYIHLLHGDDRVRPGFYDNIKCLLEIDDNVGAAFCSSIYIDDDGNQNDQQKSLKDKAGILNDALTLLGEGQKIETPSIVVKRSVYEDLGAFRAVIYGEDWDMWLRISHKYAIAYTPKYLAEYRKHSSSITAQKIESAENIRDLVKVMELTSHFFPENIRARVHKTARYNYAWFAIITAHDFWYNYKNANAATAQLNAAIKLSKNRGILLAYVKLSLKVILRIDKPILGK